MMYFLFVKEVCCGFEAGAGVEVCSTRRAALPVALTVHDVPSENIGTMWLHPQEHRGGIP